MLKARDLVFEPCVKLDAVHLCQQWHSRLPNVQKGPWQFAFWATTPDRAPVAVALWNNPSARTLPHHWLELRRMACAPEAPRNTASRFLGWMHRWFSEHCPEREKMISYQDTAVHTGCIYKAAGWDMEFVSKARVRDRSPDRVGTSRKYRSDMNGVPAAASEKHRWAKILTPNTQRRGLAEDFI